MRPALTSVPSVLFFVLLACHRPSLWAGEAAAFPPGGETMDQETIDQHIGRMGEMEEIPEGFTFSQAENSLWLSDHLANIKEPTQLYYEFTKVGNFEEGFSDAVYLSILELNEDGSKNADMEFFSGERKQGFSPENVSNVTGNPVLGIFMQGDVYEMARLTEGSWRHFHKQIKVALREMAEVQEITVEFGGKEVNAEKIVFHPYLKDPYRNRFEKFSNKLYEITLSKEVPGTLYQIRTVIDDQEGGSVPLMEEVLTLVSAKPLRTPPSP